MPSHVGGATEAARLAPSRASAAGRARSSRTLASLVRLDRTTTSAAAVSVAQRLMASSDCSSTGSRLPADDVGDREHGDQEGRPIHGVIHSPTMGMARFGRREVEVGPVRFRVWRRRGHAVLIDRRAAMISTVGE